MEEMELFDELLALLAEGRPVSTERLAAAVGRPREEVVEAIRSLPDVEYDDEGRVIGAGLTLEPTRHRFRLGERTLYTWCAWDSLTFPAVLGRRAEVESTCPVTGTTIRLTVSPEGLESVDPPEPVMSLPDPDLERVCGGGRSTFCRRSNFFSSVQAARAWTEGREGIEILSVSEGFRLGRALHAECRTGTRESTSRDREIACRLPAAEQERQWNEVASEVFGAVEATRELSDGYAFRLPSEDEGVRRLTEYILRERDCCPSFRFEVVLETDGGPAWLHLRGGKDVKRFVHEQFRSRIPGASSG